VFTSSSSPGVRRKRFCGTTDVAILRLLTFERKVNGRLISKYMTHGQMGSGRGIAQQYPVKMPSLTDPAPYGRGLVDQDLIEAARPTSPQDEYDDVKNLEDENAALRSQFTYAQSKALLRRADWHILPLLILLYLSKNMDGNLVSVRSAPHRAQGGAHSSTSKR
jgi:hypothetical protein